MKKEILITLSLLVTSYLNAQWTALDSGTDDPFQCVYFPTRDTGFAVTADYINGGKIFMTTDGINWEQSYVSSDYLFSIFFISSKVGWAGGGVIDTDGVILKTDDGGITWNPQPADIEQVSSIFFINDSVGWAVGNDGTQGTYFIYHTSNAGFTWETQKTGTDYLRSVFFIDNLQGWVAGDNGRIFHTIDGGLNWELQNTGDVFHFNSIFFASDSLGWAVGHYGRGGCYKASFDSLDWEPLDIGTAEMMTCISFISTNSGWAVGEYGTIIKTRDKGLNWTSEDSNINSRLSSVYMIDSTSGYAVGDDGIILKYNPITSISSIKSRNDIMVFPNPSHGILNVYLASDNLMILPFQVEIYSLQGEKVFSSYLTQSGNIEVDITDYPVGTYLLKVNDKEHYYTEKIIRL